MGIYPENKSRTGWDKRAKKAINENLVYPSSYHHKGKNCTNYDKKRVRKRPVNEEKGIKIGKKGEK
jgi:hypothetical protein